jgi:hypothetical protein
VQAHALVDATANSDSGNSVDTSSDNNVDPTSNINNDVLISDSDNDSDSESNATMDYSKDDSSSEEEFDPLDPVKIVCGSCGLLSVAYPLDLAWEHNVSATPYCKKCYEEQEVNSNTNPDTLTLTL